MRNFGIRSAVAPVHRHGAIRAVLTQFWAYPHQFASGWTHSSRLPLQNRWDLMRTATQSHRHVIDVGRPAQIRSLLHGGGVSMFVQPIVNLADGAPVKAEALARPCAPDGAILVPGQFLSALGETDLDARFRQGSRAEAAHLRRWRNDKLDVRS